MQAAIFSVLTAALVVGVVFLIYTLVVWSYHWAKNQRFMAEIEANRNEFTKTPRSPKKPR